MAEKSRVIGIHDQEVLSALGRYWAEIGTAEVALAMLYACMLGEDPADGDKSLAWTTFRQIQAFSIRLDILTATVPLSPDPRKEFLIETITLARAVFARRNIYAHGLFEADQATNETFVTPFFSHDSRRKERQALTAEIIQSDLATIQKLVARVVVAGGMP